MCPRQPHHANPPPRSATHAFALQPGGFVPEPCGWQLVQGTQLIYCSLGRLLQRNTPKTRSPLLTTHDLGWVRFVRPTPRVVSPYGLEDGPGVRGDARPLVGALLGHRAEHGRALHLALVVHNHPGIVLEEDEDAVLPPERLALPHHDRRHHLFTQLGLALFHRGHDHVTRGRGRQAVQHALYQCTIPIKGGETEFEQPTEVGRALCRE
mmetsp:Transcript_48092/g.109254  ORF Transcript_48092/g.109254 Transcript_48092/m.109254 type:complete len:209 (+) Transcript_48092:231-857(+)